MIGAIKEAFAVELFAFDKRRGGRMDGRAGGRTGERTGRADERVCGRGKLDSL